MARSTKVRKNAKKYNPMELDIYPVKNGWVINDHSHGESTVFTDREEMMKHLNDILPETQEQSQFVEAIDEEPADPYEDSDDPADLFGVLMNDAINSIKARR